MPHLAGLPTDVGDKDQVNATGVTYRRMAKHWPLLQSLLDGTAGMRDARETFLPKEDKEKDPAYEARLTRTFLYNAFGNTIDTVVSKPFSERVTVTPESDQLDEKLQGIEGDTDLGGRDLTEYASDVFRPGVAFGLHFGLVDMPAGLGGGLSLQDERDLGIRPYFIDVDARDLLGFKSHRVPNGEEELTQVRIREMRVEATGQYTEKEAEYIRVINAPGFGTLPTGELLGEGDETFEMRAVPTGRGADGLPTFGEGEPLGTWELWRRTDDKDQSESDFVLVSEGLHTYPGVPLTAYYSERVGFMEAAPPLRDLAELNLAHWQSTSDQRNITHFVRLAILMFTGMTEDEIDKGVVVGVNRSVMTTNSEARGFYVEHSGAGIKAGADDLQQLEEKMVVLGMTPFMRQQGGQRTRIGDERVVSTSITNIQAWIRNLESFLARMYEIAATWIGVELPDDFAVSVFNEFGLSMRAELDIKALLQMRQQKLITHERFLMEVQRRGIVGDDMVIEDELRNIALEDPMKDEPPLPPDPDEKDDEEETDDEVEPEGGGDE